MHMFIARYCDLLNVDISCDGCDEIAPWHRYRCLQCSDMDLCKTCFLGKFHGLTMLYLKVIIVSIFCVLPSFKTLVLNKNTAQWSSLTPWQVKTLIFPTQWSTSLILSDIFLSLMVLGRHLINTQDQWTWLSFQEIVFASESGTVCK
jgi:hypothetical protein